jgi:hypothetical protein
MASYRTGIKCVALILRAEFLVSRSLAPSSTTPPPSEVERVFQRLTVDLGTYSAPDPDLPIQPTVPSGLRLFFALYC